MTKLSVQKDFKRLGDSRSIFLDAYAKDSKGKIFDLEIQCANAGADVHRARYYSSVMDVKNLKANQDYDELPETYTIFITEKISSMRVKRFTNLGSQNSKRMNLSKMAGILYMSTARLEATRT